MAATEFVPDQANDRGSRGPCDLDDDRPRCDGDSVAMTSAVNPSLEDIVTQAIPGMPEGDRAQPRARL